MKSIQKLPAITIIFLSILLESHGNRKAKRTKELLAQPPKYELHLSETLPRDIQVSTFLYKGENKEFKYWSTVMGSSLTFTVTTCTSPVQWSVVYRKSNVSMSEVKYHEVIIKNETTYDMKTIHFTSSKGIYLLNISAKERETYVHLYVSTEVGGPQALQSDKTQDIRLFKRQRRKRLTVRWDPSLVDPQETDYCLVVNIKQHYTTLCSAQHERYGNIPPKINSNQPEAASQIITNWDDSNNYDSQKYPIVICVGNKSHYTLSNLKPGQGYYFDVFAINKRSNLTYPHGMAFTIFNRNSKATSLRDGKPATFNLKKLDGKAVFRFKIGRKSGNSLELFIMPCGGAVDVEISLKGEIVELRRWIEGFGKIEIQNTKKGNRYYIKVYSSNKEELLRTTGVEMYVTTNSSLRVPLPAMPQKPIVQEYVSLRTCHSVTVGWLASHGHRTAHYCVVVKEGKLRDIEGYRLPNQCGLESRLKKSADFTAKYCRDINVTNQVVTQKISQLKPKRNYIVQVTVKTPGGKTLSYDLLQVKTKHYCD